MTPDQKEASCFFSRYRRAARCSYRVVSSGSPNRGPVCVLLCRGVAWSVKSPSGQVFMTSSVSCCSRFVRPSAKPQMSGSCRRSEKDLSTLRRLREMPCAAASHTRRQACSASELSSNRVVHCRVPRSPPMVLSVLATFAECVMRGLPVGRCAGQSFGRSQPPRWPSTKSRRLQ